MARLTPQSWQTLKKVFEPAGFREDRTSGDHICMVRPGTPRPVIIPKYSEVGRDIIQANLRTAGLSRDAYLALLRKA